jgi:hypothetical protein
MMMVIPERLRDGSGLNSSEEIILLVGRVAVDVGMTSVDVPATGPVASTFADTAGNVIGGVLDIGCEVVTGSQPAETNMTKVKMMAKFLLFTILIPKKYLKFYPCSRKFSGFPLINSSFQLELDPILEYPVIIQKTPVEIHSLFSQCCDYSSGTYWGHLGVRKGCFNTCGFPQVLKRATMIEFLRVFITKMGGLNCSVLNI